MYVLTVRKHVLDKSRQPGRRYIMGLFDSKQEARKWSKTLPQDAEPEVKGPIASIHFPNAIGKWSYVGTN